jgi:UDP-N-acetylmuramoyl-tripeptide--D-alanyl-D-alanine ligase
MNLLLAALFVVATIPAGLRWLRVAQREHYLAPSVTRFAMRWWFNGAANLLLALVAVAGVVGSVFSPFFAVLVPLAQLGPIGLTVKGASSPLAWTGRLKRLAIAAGFLVLIVYVVGTMIGAPVLLASGLLLLPSLIDVALVLLAPIESRMGSRWVDKAASKLKAIGPEVVAITGSYGKTTTKNYLAHLLTGSRRVLASPASFNNRMGLARAVNENLAPGTEVFIAEMGTYGPGEIAELCEWIPPKVAAMVAVGPVHLERFRTEERIVDAKSEILERAEVGVICVDHPLLRDLAGSRSETMRIIEVSTEDDQIHVDGVAIAPVPDGAFPANAAVAVGIGLVLGVPPENLLTRLTSLPSAEHRQSVSRSSSGFSIIDDTFNSNPAGARRGLELLTSLGGEGKTAVVTPGMVELGPVQNEENRAFAEAAARKADHLIIVGTTNRSPLLEGSGSGDASVTVVRDREEAVAWVRANLGEGDAVLYENDLPDHYP